MVLGRVWTYINSWNPFKAQEAGTENEGRCSEQLASRDAAYQEELSKLHQQHHQDMLSVINDCCRKVKGGFTRQHKPYDVFEIHAVIDDIEQKMVREILSEIQKTNTHEDLSSFEEAFESVKHSRELGEARDDAVKPTTMTTEDISAALGAFENENFDNFNKNWSEELMPTKNAGGEESYEEPQEPVVEVINKSQGMITGDRGNLDYADELKRTIDEMTSVAGDAVTKKDSEDLTPSLPQNTKTYEEIEASLDSMIVSGDTPCDLQPSTDADYFADLKSLEATIASETAGQESPSEIFKKDLMSLDTCIEADSGALSSPDFSFTSDLLSLDAQIARERDKTEAPPSSSSKEDEYLKSFEEKIATDAKGSTGDQEQLRSLEAKLESDVPKEASGKAKAGDAVVKQSSPTKEQIQASQSQNAPAKQEKQPAKETPAKETPAKVTPAKVTPVKETPAKEIPAKVTPAKETPVKETPAKETPAKETPAKETPVKVTPAKETPAKETPAPTVSKDSAKNP